MKKTLFAALLYAFPGLGAAGAGLLPPHAFTDDARGTTAASFLKSPASARLSALGFGAAALRAPDAFFYNPAGAAYLPEGSGALMLGYESLLEGSGRGAIAGLKGLGRGVLGLGALYRYDTGLEKYDIYGDSAGGVDVYDAAFTGFYGARTGPADAGLAVKYIRSKLANRSADSVALDLGVLIKDKAGTGAEFGGTPETDFIDFRRRKGEGAVAVRGEHADVFGLDGIPDLGVEQEPQGQAWRQAEFFLHFPPGGLFIAFARCQVATDRGVPFTRLDVLVPGAFLQQHLTGR